MTILNRYKWPIGAISLVLLITAAIVIIGLTRRNSSIVLHDEYGNVEMIVRETPATGVFSLSHTDGARYIRIHQKAQSKLTLSLETDEIVDITVTAYDGTHLGHRTVFYNSNFTIYPTGQAEQYVIQITPSNRALNADAFEGELTVHPQGASAVTEAYTIRFASPSPLQLALFAHMAYFPFDFNAGAGPSRLGFDYFHYGPFCQIIMTQNPQAKNRYGFSFFDEVSGWYLAQVYEAPTGFQAVAYTSQNSIVITIKGSDGDLDIAFREPTGTWWYSFRALGGHPHSHLESLSSFLQGLEDSGLLHYKQIYITGHSLGGYLSYIATYELVQMGFEDSIGKVATFSTPIFCTGTTRRLLSLDPKLRSRITHYYVPGDMIANIIGPELHDPLPPYDVFVLLNQLLGSLRDVHDMDVSFWVYQLSNVTAAAERLAAWFTLSFPFPDHLNELIWWIERAVSEDAMTYSQEFRALIWQEHASQTWHSYRPIPVWSPEDGLIDALINYVTERTTYIVLGIFQNIFDWDTHLMMNFYGELSRYAQS